MYFYGLNLGSPGAGQSWTQRPFLCISMARTWDSLAGAILDPGTFVWTNSVKDHQSMLHNKFQAPEPSSSGEEEF